MTLPRASVALAAGLACALWMGACGEVTPPPIPTLYLLAGKVVDPTTNPFTPLAGARVSVETAPQVAAVTSDADGVFLLHGVPEGEQRLRAELAGYRVSVSIGVPVSANVTDASLPLFTDSEIDSILVARAAPPWDRARALIGMFALRSNGLPLGSAAVTLSPLPPHAGGVLLQTGQAEDPIVIVNAVPGDYLLSVTNAGYRWATAYGTRLTAGVVTFGAPHAFPNLAGYLFADHSTGVAVDAASVTVLSGPTPAGATTDFLGQFSLVGLQPGTYVAGFDKTGFLSGCTWPQPMAQDTTLTCVLVHPDTLAAWSAAQGGPAPAPDRGHVAVEARSLAGGALLLGAVLASDPAGGAMALPQTTVAPALLVNLPPGTYTIRVSGPGITGTPESVGVTVRAGAVTYSRLDL
jgi:hypothetical protein